MIQIQNLFVNNNNEANERLRIFQKEYPKRKIINVNLIPNDPMGWFMTIVYEINI